MGMCFVVILDSKHGAENITDIVDRFCLFFDKHGESVIQDTSRYTDQYKLQEVKIMLCLGLPCSVSDYRSYFKKLVLMLTPGFMGIMSRAILELITHTVYSVTES
jgi:hypothetical protein